MHRRVREGIGRSFQSLELFDDMTVADNLKASVDARSGSAYLTDLVWPRPTAFTAGALAAVELFELGPDLDRLPTELPYGRRRLVGIARAVAAEPSILCLDEPAGRAELDRVGRAGRAAAAARRRARHGSAGRRARHGAGHAGVRPGDRDGTRADHRRRDTGRRAP
ncbi:ATP-binding cassette domain-containing protein [Nonomuraea ferruginea]